VSEKERDRERERERERGRRKTGGTKRVIADKLAGNEDF
jgi:hypothetical protein